MFVLILIVDASDGRKFNLLHGRLGLKLKFKFVVDFLMDSRKVA